MYCIVVAPNHTMAGSEHTEAQELEVIPEVEGYGQFMSRISKLPIVTSAMEQLAAIYKTTKERNKLIKVTLETAESGVRVAFYTAQPIANRTPSNHFP